MIGAELKEVVGRIPDDAEIVEINSRYLGWRCAGGELKCFSFKK